MTTIKTLIKSHAVLSYYVLVFLITWGGTLIVSGLDGFVGSKPISAAQLPFAYLTFLAGPSIGGVLLTGFVYGRAGFDDLVARLVKWQVSIRWYAIAFLTAPLATIAILLALSLSSPIFLPAIVTADDKAGLLASAVVVGLVVAFFEELGWTGFAIPELRKRYDTLAAGLGVGLVWGAWHLPLFAASANSSTVIPSGVYLAVLLFSWLPPYRVLMVWVCNHTKSLFVAILMHAPIVVSQFVLIPTALADNIVTFDLVFTAVLWSLVAVVAMTRSRLPSRFTNALR